MHLHGAEECLILMQMKSCCTVCVVDVLGPQVCFAAWPNCFKRLWIKSFLHICRLTAPQIGTKSQNKWRIMTFSLCINIFWICVCVVSSGAGVLVCVLENPRPPPGCRRVWAVCWNLPTLLSWIMLLLQSLSEMEQHLYQNIRAFCSAHRRLFSNLIALLPRNSLLISRLRLFADGLYPLRFCTSFICLYPEDSRSPSLLTCQF